MSQIQSDHAQSTSDVSVGSLLAGKYRVDRVLGRGGMGIVVAATHVELGSPVAIKLLLPEVRGNQEVVARFAREARAAAQITSEYVARTVDVGRLENGSPYIVMEYLDGSDLAQRIAQCGPLPFQGAVKLILQACEALEEAHALGIIHRDLKPSNLFLARRRDGSEVTKLLDFGISKVTSVTDSASNPSMTRTSSMMGSPLYMSPEQLVAARDVDQRSDVWALGVTLYEALAGEPPFSGESLPELCARVMTQAPRPINVLRPDLPAELAAAVMRCLEKSPDARFATAADLSAALRPFALHLSSAIGERDTGNPAVISEASPPPGQFDAPLRRGSRPDLAGGGVRTANSWGQTNDVPVIPMRSKKPSVLLASIAGLLVVGAFVGWKFSQTEVGGSSPIASNRQASLAPDGETHPTAPATHPSQAATSASAAAPPVVNPTTVQSARNEVVTREVAPRAVPRINRPPSGGSAVKNSNAPMQPKNDIFSDRN